MVVMMQHRVAMVVVVMATLVVRRGFAQGAYSYATYGEYDDYGGTGGGGGVYDNYDDNYDEYDDYELPVPPVFISESQVLKVEVGRDVTLPCNVDNMGDYSMILTKKQKDGKSRILYVGDNALKPARRIVKNGTEFTIRGVRRTNAGEYECRIEASPAIELSHTVDVLYAPTVKLVTPTVQSIREGGNVTFECQADGNPAPAMTWTKANGELPQGAVQEMEEEGVAVLEVVGVEVGDAGEYVCSAHNGVNPPSRPHPHHHTTTTATLHVLYPPQVTAEQHIETTPDGGFAGVLSCEVTGYPKPEVTWRRTDLNDLPAHAQESPAHTLLLQPLGTEDLGEYICRAENDFGVHEEEVDLLGLLPAPQVTSGEAGGPRAHPLTISTSPSLTPPVPPTTYRLRLKEVHENEEEEEEEEEEPTDEENEIEPQAEPETQAEPEEPQAEAEPEPEPEPEAEAQAEPEPQAEEGYHNNTTSEVEPEQDTTTPESIDPWTTSIYPISEATGGDVTEGGAAVHLTHTIEGLEPHTHYQVTVALQNEFGWSPESEVLDFWTTEDTTTTTTTTTTSTTTTTTTTRRPPQGRRAKSGVAELGGSVKQKVLRVVVMAVAVLVLGAVVW